MHPALHRAVCVPAQVRQMIADGHPWFAEMVGPQWSLLELSTGHWPMFSEPHRLADLLHEPPGAALAGDLVSDGPPNVDPWCST